MASSSSCTRSRSPLRAGGGFGDKGKGEGKVKGKSKGKRMEINVKTQAGENITMDFEASDTIDNVKARMPTTLQSPDIRVMVEVAGGRTLADLGLVGGDSLFVVGGGICLECNHFRAAAKAALVESRELAMAEDAVADEESVAVHRPLQWRLQQLMGRMGFSWRALQTEYMASVKKHTPTRIARAQFLFNFFTTVDLTRFLIYEDESELYDQETPHFSTSETEPYRTTQTLHVIQHPSAPRIN